MKQIINGKVYDTDTANWIGSGGKQDGSFSDYWEDLYRTKKGAWFLRGKGGPASCYAESAGQNCWTGGCRIVPLTEHEAKEWSERHLSAEKYIELFGAEEA